MLSKCRPNHPLKSIFFYDRVSVNGHKVGCAASINGSIETICLPAIVFINDNKITIAFRAIDSSYLLSFDMGRKGRRNRL